MFNMSQSTQSLPIPQTLYFLTLPTELMENIALFCAANDFYNLRLTNR